MAGGGPYVRGSLLLPMNWGVLQGGQRSLALLSPLRFLDAVYVKLKHQKTNAQRATARRRPREGIAARLRTE